MTIIKKVDDNLLILTCLQCGKELQFDKNSSEAQGVFNVFCPDKDCEDIYAASH